MEASIEVDEDSTTSKCCGCLSYVRDHLIHQNWNEFKELVQISKKENCSCNRKKKVDQADDSDDDDEIIKLPKHSGQFLTSNYISGKAQVPEDALLHYINKLDKTEKIDFVFISQMLKKGVKINACDELGENAIFKAARIENDVLVSFLLEKNVDTMKLNFVGCNIFHMTARNNNPIITRLIADKFQKNALLSYIDMKTTDEEQTPLHYACKKGAVAVAECFISEYGADREVLDYRLRTPLYIAAEIGHQSMVKALMRLNCNVAYSDSDKTITLNNITGQSPLYWIVTKMPDIAKEALDQLHETNSYLRKERHYIAALEPAVPKDKTIQTIAKSVLDGIVEKENFDLVEHPTVKCFINYKWKKIARWSAWLDFLFTILNISTWITVAVLYPLNSSETYLSAAINIDPNYLKQNPYLYQRRSGFSSLLVLGILFTIYLVFLELKEVYSEYKYQKRCNDLRKRELEEYKSRAKEKNVNLSFYADEFLQIDQNNFFKVLVEYITDIWNIYDWISVGLLLGCVGIYTTASVSSNNAELMSLTIIFISLRLLKTSRILIPKLGTLVLILYYTVSHVIVWISVFSVIWLSFSLSLWLIYGDVKYDLASSANLKCIDVKNETANAINNCTVVTVPGLETFSKAAYSLFRQTFGTDIDEDKMNLINDQLTSALLGLYVGLTALVLVNIFIGLLSATFTKIYDKAEAFILLQRAEEILNAEKSMSFIERKFRIRQLRKCGNPYTVRLEKEILSYSDDKMANLENELTEQRKILMNMEKNLEYSNMAFKHQSSKTNTSLEKIEMHELKLENIIDREAKMEDSFTKFVTEYREKQAAAGVPSTVQQGESSNQPEPSVPVPKLTNDEVKK